MGVEVEGVCERDVLVVHFFELSIKYYYDSFSSDD